MPPPDLFYSSHIIRLFPELCEDSCTGSRCQIVSDSNCLPLYTEYRCLHVKLPPSYLSDLLVPATVHAHLRSSVTLERSLSIPRTKTKTLGPCGFYFASSASWNALAVHLHDPELSLNSFKTIKIENPLFFLTPPIGHLICS